MSADQTNGISPDISKVVDQMQLEADKLAKESNGGLKLPSRAEQLEVRAFPAVYINRFMASVMKNNMVRIGLSVEHAPDEATFLSAFCCTIQDIASLHQLLTKLLTAFQQQQQMMIQHAQGKVNPDFLKTMQAMQESNENEKKAE